jgi:hypothetical protein
MKRKLSKILGIGLSIALMTSLLIAAVPASALSSPQVTVTPPTISQPATYLVEFEVAKQLTGNGTLQDTFTITFPAGTVVGAPTATIVIGPGWVDSGAGPVWDSTPDNIDGGTWTVDPAPVPTWLEYELPAGGVYAGSSAEIRVEITAGIENPDTPGDYTLTVKTSQETTAVTSQTYAIGEPTIDPLSGIVMGYNSAGILMAQSHEIQDCIDAAGVDGRVEIGPGTYTLPWDVDDPTHEGQTIVGTGDPGTVIIKSMTTIDVTQDDVTIDGLTIHPGGGDPLVMVTGEDVTVTNCDFSAGTAFSPAVSDVLWTAGVDTTISNCTFDTTRPGPQTGIEIDVAKATVTDCTLNVGDGDQGIDANDNAAISGVTITGSSGEGVDVDGSTTTIDDSSFMSLTTAILNSGTATVSNSVIDGCGSATPAGGAAVESASILRMYNCTIQNTSAVNYAFNLGAGTDAEVHFNNILNNPMNVQAVDTANFSHNWWGSVDGPAFGTNAGPVTTTPPLGNSVTAAGLTIDGAAVVGKTTVGVDANVLTGTGTPGFADVLGIAAYSANPELTPPTIMGTGSVVGYYDVFAAGVAAGNYVQIKFYVPVSPYTKVYYAGGISGRWADAGGDVNMASGFAYVTVGGIDSGLTVSDLGGTVFAVVEDKTTTTGPSIASGVGSPVIGAYDVSIDPMFTWGAVPGAIRYEIALSEDPTFTIIEWSYNVDQAFYKVDEPLRYDTTYYWRVRGVLGEPYQQARQWVTPSSPWTVGIFTTASEPEPPADPIVVQPTKPEVNVEIPPTKITIEPAEQAIPNYMLWIIVAVGAVLVIALIVLIVRTRRVV